MDKQTDEWERRRAVSEARTEMREYITRRDSLSPTSHPATWTRDKGKQFDSLVTPAPIRVILSDSRDFPPISPASAVPG